MDFGAQNDLTETNYPFVRHSYWKRWIKDYECIDVNGKGEALYFDLGAPIMYREFDLVADAGTKEHVKNIYMAFLNQCNMTKTGGLMYCENPKVGSWPEHGHHFFTLDFYRALVPFFGEILHLEEHPCNPADDGWEIICLIRKQRDFPSKTIFNEIFDRLCNLE